MQKTRNALVALFLLMMIMGPTLVYCAEVMQVGLPSWLTAEGAKWLSGGVEDKNVKKSLNIHGFINKELQKSTENEVGNRIPMKANAILGSAALQGHAIMLSNSVFRWECYPTFFGSDKLYIPQQNAFTYRPQIRNVRQDNLLESFSQHLKDWALRHPEKKVVVFAVQGFQEPEYNPAYSLMSSPLTPSHQIDRLQQNVKDLSNVRVLTLTHTSLSEYYESFFKTDHHWNYRGCIKAYNTLAAFLNKPQHSPSTLEHDSLGPRFVGGTSRTGLYLIEEEAHVDSNQFDDLTIKREMGL